MLAAAGCDIGAWGLEYPPGVLEARRLSALSGPEDRLDSPAVAPDETAVSFPGLFSHAQSRQQDYSVTHALYPLLSHRARGDEVDYALRPLWYVRRSPAEERTDAWFLYPLGRYIRQGSNKRFWLLPLVYYNRLVHAGRHVSEASGHTPGELSEFGRRRTLAGQSVDTDFVLFPLLFCGSDSEEGGHFAVFPLAGIVKDYLGKDWIRFLFFPLYVETQDPRYHSWNVAWPVIGWWRGEDQWGFRVFPLYGTNRRAGKFERTWFLWPIGHYWRVGLDTKTPTELVFAFPFFGYMKNKHLRYDTVLWPLFGCRRDSRRNLVELHAPWPIFSYTRGDGVRAFKIWPLWGHRSGNYYRSVFLLWPLYTRQLERREDSTLLARMVAGVYWQWTEKWREYDMGGKVAVRPPPRKPGGFWRGEDWIPDGRREPPDETLPDAPFKEYERTFWKLWPLCHSRREADDSAVFQALSVLPWPEDRGAANLLAPLWTLYRYERDADGQVREHALCGIYSHVRDARQRRLNVLGVYQYRRVGWYYKYVGILDGLVAYERVGYDKGVRLLWIPVNPIASAEWERFRGGFEETPR